MVCFEFSVCKYCVILFLGNLEHTHLLNPDKEPMAEQSKVPPKSNLVSTEYPKFLRGF